MKLMQCTRYRNIQKLRITVGIRIALLIGVVQNNCVKLKTFCERKWKHRDSYTSDYIRACTREIGIRKSLGAKTSSIVVQFLCESAILSGIGGIIGILIGAGISYGVAALKIGGLSARLSLPAILLTTGFSCGVGILFGIYPARKAARMSPIEALRQI